MPKFLKLLDSAARIVTSIKSEEVRFTSLDLKYALSQIILSVTVLSHCNLKFICGEQTGTYRFKTGFCGLKDISNNFQKAMDNIVQGLSGAFCFLDGNLIVSKDSIVEHNCLEEKDFARLEDEGLHLILSKSEFFLNKMSWFSMSILMIGYLPKKSK